MQLLPLSLCLLTLTGSTFSDDPVTKRVKEGDDVTLPCYIKKDILSERFEWKKDGEKEVYLYEGGQFSGQHDQFRGRVSHFGDNELKIGNASITISDTKVSDTGDYTCNSPKLHQTVSVRLLVGKVAKLQTTKLPKTKDGVLLLCLVTYASSGFKLNISWFDGSGNKLTEEMKVTESEELYKLQTTVTKSDTYHCAATMEELSHRVHYSVSVTDEDLNNTTGPNLTVIIESVALVLILIAVAVVGVSKYISWLNRYKRSENDADHENPEVASSLMSLSSD